MLHKLIYIGIAVSLLGCGSLVTGDSQYVEIDVTCKGQSYPTYCRAINSKGIWDFLSPQRRLIQRDSSSLKIICDSSVGRFGLIQYPIPNPIAAGNYYIGGILGAAIDAKTNAIWFYPEKITFESEFCKVFTR